MSKRVLKRALLALALVAPTLIGIPVAAPPASATSTQFSGAPFRGLAANHIGWSNGAARDLTVSIDDVVPSATPADQTNFSGVRGSTVTFRVEWSYTNTPPHPIPDWNEVYVEMNYLGHCEDCFPLVEDHILTSTEKANKLYTFSMTLPSLRLGAYYMLVKAFTGNFSSDSASCNPSCYLNVSSSGDITSNLPSGYVPDTGNKYGDGRIVASGGLLGYNGTNLVNNESDIAVGASFTDGQTYASPNQKKFTSATANFVVGDAGRKITGANIPAGTTIASRVNATEITLSQNATGAGSGLSFTLKRGFRMASIREFDSEWRRPVSSALDWLRNDRRIMIWSMKPPASDVFFDGSITSGLSTITSNTAQFTSSDVGKRIVDNNKNSPKIPSGTTISSVTCPCPTNTATMSAAATANKTNLAFTVGRWSSGNRRWSLVWDSNHDGSADSGQDAVIDDMLRDLQTAAMTGITQAIITPFHEPHDALDGSPPSKCKDYTAGFDYKACQGTAADYQKVFQKFRDHISGLNGVTSACWDLTESSTCDRVLLSYTAVPSNMTGTDALYPLDPSSNDNVIDLLTPDPYNWFCYHDQASSCDSSDDWDSFQATVTATGKDVVTVAKNHGRQLLFAETASHPGCPNGSSDLGCGISPAIVYGPTSFHRDTWFQDMANYLKTNTDAKQWIIGFNYFGSSGLHDWRFVENDSLGSYMGLPAYKTYFRDDPYFVQGDSGQFWAPVWIGADRFGI